MSKNLIGLSLPINTNKGGRKQSHDIYDCMSFRTKVLRVLTVDIWKKHFTLKSKLFDHMSQGSERWYPWVKISCTGDNCGVAAMNKQLGTF